MKSIRKLKNNRKILILICIIVMFFLGTAYSALSQNLTLEGTITIPKNDTSFTATITKNIFGSWLSTGTYDIKITNNGSTDITSWIAVITVSNLTSESQVSSSILSNGLNSWTVDLTQKTITITNEDISNGGTISAGGSVTYALKITSSNPTLSIKIYSTMSEVTSSVKTMMMQANRNIASELTIAEEDNLSSFVYTIDNVDFIVEFEKVNREDRKK